MIKIKGLLYSLLFFVTSGSYSQNLASSLYEIDYFPKEMQPIQDFINKTCAAILVYNYQYSSFEIRDKNYIAINLPLKDEFSITFQGKDSNELASKYEIYYDYRFPYAKLQPNFEINDTTFSLPSIFEIAVEYFQFSAYNILPELTKMRKDIRSYDEYIAMQIDFFSALAKDYNIHTPLYETATEQIEEQNYTLSEIDEFLVDTLIEHLNNEDEEALITSFFEQHIFKKFTTEKTKHVLDYMFNREDLVGFIEKEVLQPKVNFQLYQGGFFNFPKKYAEILSDEIHSFPIQAIHVQIDFKEKKMKLDFESKFPKELILKKAFYLGSKVKNKRIKTTKLSIEISTEKPVFSVEDFADKGNLYTIEINK